MTITRRDFISGFAVGAAALQLSPRLAIAAGQLDPRALGEAYYPPALTGLRGSHAGAFETAHAMAMQGQRWSAPEQPLDPVYDLVVVGGGVSGLAAAYFFRELHGKDARILVLDNHDDFGGHAKRNEFRAGERTLIGYGGSQSIDTPSAYSLVAIGLLRKLGIDITRFNRYYDGEFTRKHELGYKLYFSRARYGVDLLLDDPAGEPWLDIEGAADPEPLVRRLPLPAGAQDALLRLLREPRDPLPGLDLEQKLARLRGMSYDDFLRKLAGMPEDVVTLLRNSSASLWGVGYDALSALEATREEMPGTRHLGIDEHLAAEHPHHDPYIFHFPDGNAGVARLLVRALVPDAASGTTMEDMVTARLDYATLDRAANPVRIRLDSTAVDVRHSADGNTVDVVYLQGGGTSQAARVRARHAVLACWNHVIPHICTELPAAQREALRFPQKTPLVYVNVALHNWRAAAKAGLFRFRAPQEFFCYGMLDFPVSLPGYAFSASPDEPIVLHLLHAPTVPGLPVREQYRQGRAQLLALSFADFEREILRLLSGMLGAYGFDAARDIAGITVNRWPHGYAYEYVDLVDPPEWNPQNGPHITARAQHGRISIANADSQARAYLDAAIDAAWRAVSEQHS
jgi:spermidine dehydrogenase